MDGWNNYKIMTLTGNDLIKINVMEMSKTTIYVTRAPFINMD